MKYVGAVYSEVRLRDLQQLRPPFARLVLAAASL